MNLHVTRLDDTLNGLLIACGLACVLIANAAALTAPSPAPQMVQAPAAVLLAAAK